MTTHQTNVHAVFSSIQGEGPHTGEPMTFVRLQGCGLSCRWCDTTDSLTRSIPIAKIETEPLIKQFHDVSNPITSEQLTAILAAFSDPTIAITGGEPLEHAAFLEPWLPTLPEKKRILLETAGVHTQALKRVLPYLDIVSMDMKLPSSTGMRAYWKEHRAFLQCAVAAKVEIYVKMVVSAQTSVADVDRAVELITRIDSSIPTILQSASVTTHFADTPSCFLLSEHLSRCTPHLQCVTVGYQMHKQWGVL
jgi:7-carboxy-7-deazaguanine synthase